MKKIFVFGSTGMLGHMVLKVLSQEKSFEVIGTQSHDPHAPFYFDVLKGIDTLTRIVDSPPLSYFINCIGVLSPINDVARAQAINARFPHALADYAKTIGARVIHMSTNGVFSTNVPSPSGRGQGEVYHYKENDPPNATDSYGKTKIEGEVIAPHVLNIRCSIIGPSPIKKKGLFEWFRSQSDGATIQGYTNHYWNGVTTLQFSELCRHIIIGDYFEALRQESPAVHFVPNQTVTKYELLLLFQKLLQKRITIQATEDPRGEQAQLLACTSKILPSLFPHDIPMRQAVADLAPYEDVRY